MRRAIAMLAAWAAAPPSAADAAEGLRWPVVGPVIRAHDGGHRTRRDTRPCPGRRHRQSGRARRVLAVGFHRPRRGHPHDLLVALGCRREEGRGGVRGPGDRPHGTGSPGPHCPAPALRGEDQRLVRRPAHAPRAARSSEPHPARPASRSVEDRRKWHRGGSGGSSAGGNPLTARRNRGTPLEKPLEWVARRAGPITCPARR